jgi:hypothetical protein
MSRFRRFSIDPGSIFFIGAEFGTVYSTRDIVIVEMEIGLVEVGYVSWKYARKEAESFSNVKNKKEKGDGPSLLLIYCTHRGCHDF